MNKDKFKQLPKAERRKVLKCCDKYLDEIDNIVGQLRVALIVSSANTEDAIAKIRALDDLTFSYFGIIKGVK